MLTISPNEQYQALVNSDQISFDNAQQEAVTLLQNLHLVLGANSSHKNHKTALVNGVYLWGKVGRGKTFLMDLFVDSLPNNLCKRQHFHHFMQDVHQQLNDLSGKAEPLRHIAKKFSRQYRVLCFDEFFVSDIGDAMLLGSLLQHLFELNIVVVCTSNCAPEELYKNGLQRARFLPAIAAIERFMDILHLSGEQDHRHRKLTYVQNYFELPYTEAQQEELHLRLLNQHVFASTNTGLVDASSLTEQSGKIDILGREIDYIAQSSSHKNRSIAFDFSALCQGPRSHFDYVELAKTFKSILLFNVPPMSGQAYERIKARGTEDNGSTINGSATQTGEREVVLAPMDDAVRRFIALVDECYDCNLKLFITAHVSLEQLYNNGTLLFEFERTRSRLTEMASMEYLSNTSV